LSELAKIEYSLVTHIGKVRKNHEDNYYTCDGEFISVSHQKDIGNGISEIRLNKTIELDPANPTVFAVADGMGGHKAGEVASNLVVTMLDKCSKQASKKQNKESFLQLFKDVVLLINRVIADRSSSKAELRGMGSTLAMMLFEKGKAVSVNVGDSRTYLYENGTLKQLSRDHTFGQQLRDLGMDEADDPEINRHRKALMRYMGMECDITESIAEITQPIVINENQIYMLCSDGLTDEVSDESISEIFKTSNNLNDVESKLLEAALNGSEGKVGGIDNITVLLIRFSGERQKEKTGTNDKSKTFFSRLFGKNRGEKK